MIPDYLAIGHVTEDVWRDGRITPGGTVIYASRAACAFVGRVSVLTAAADSFDTAGVFPGVQVQRVPSPVTTQFENVYTARGRVQHTRPSPVVLEPRHLTGELRGATVMHLAPVCDEVSAAIATEAESHVFIGVTPQGWLRRWDASGRVWPRPWDAAGTVLPRADAVVASIHDVAGDWDLLRSWAARTRLLVVTMGKDGCQAFIAGQPHSVPAPRVEEVDPTGAGDIFAATLFITLQRGSSVLDACAFASCIAAQSVTRPQLEGLPTREDIERCSTIC
jgi:sugar/nucleoside kinase (ribokinase family)